ncbi:MAG: hypothetical protein HY420_00725 [Candidatus Kerfeldbacteria bacterium]|nr:hypothetical protein [Candidatus Kerfeldbacteria bacterium]
MVNDVKHGLEGLLKPEVIETELGRVKILAIFRTEASYQIIGGKVTDGKVLASSLLRVLRHNQVMAEGKLTQLQSQKSNVAEVPSGQECGMKYEGPPVVQVGDVVVVLTRQVRSRTIGG